MSDVVAKVRGLTRSFEQGGVRIDVLRGPPLPVEPAQEARDRRVQRDAFELVELEQPVATYGFVPRDDIGEGAVEVGCEDDVDDVLRPQAPLGRDRVDDQIGRAHV